MLRIARRLAWLVVAGRAGKWLVESGLVVASRIDSALEPIFRFTTGVGGERGYKGVIAGRDALFRMLPSLLALVRFEFSEPHADVV